MKRWIIFLSCLCGALTASAQQEHDHVKIVRDNADSVVAINVLQKDGATVTGTGFVLTPDGLIATNKHVTDNSLFMNITFNSGLVSAEATLVATADQVDLALLKIEANNLPFVTLGNSDTVLPGQTVTVIGNPRRLQNTVTSGLISQIRQKPNGILWHQISAPISHSSSGSPVFNAQGEVISVAFGSYAGEGDQNLNFAIPVNYLKKLVAQNGYALPQPAPAAQKQSPNKWVAHVQKSWEIVKRIFSSQD